LPFARPAVDGLMLAAVAQANACAKEVSPPCSATPMAACRF